MARLTAEWPSLGSSDGTRAKSLGLAARPVEEVVAPIALIGQKDASARRPRQGGSGDLVASVTWKKHNGDYHLCRLMDERMDLEPVKPAARGCNVELRAILGQQTDSVGQLPQATNPLLVPGTVGKGPLSIGDGELIGAFERVGSEVPSHQSDHDYLGIGEIWIVIVRPTPSGHFRVRLQVIVDKQVAFEQVGFEVTGFYVG